MMFASHYMSEWTPVLFPYEMPIRSGECAKSRAGSGIVVARICGRFVGDGHCWRSKDRRYESQVKRQVNGARLKAAATNSTATITPGRFCVSDFAYPFSAVNSSEVRNEKLQH
jgi:hypothetical protein